MQTDSPHNAFQAASVPPGSDADPSPVPVERLDRANAAQRLNASQATINVSAVAAEAANDSANDAAVKEWQYPQVVSEGVCSHKLAADTFNVLDAVQRASGASEASILGRLRALRAVCAFIAEKTGAQWVGVYAVVGPSGDCIKYGGDCNANNLMKLAYIGAPSRPYFPLTQPFADNSNNSTVAMSGDAVVYHDVLALPSDAPYYTCDAQVRSEACVPILDSEGTVIGIMDAESFSPDCFRPAESLGIVLAACEQLGQTKLLLDAAPKEEHWIQHTCRLPAKLSPEERRALEQQISLRDRTEFFRLSCCPITAQVEQRMEQISTIVSREQYADHWENGDYRCARCRHSLYDDTAKFVGPCLWPSFRASKDAHGSLHTISVPPGAYNKYECEVHELYCGQCKLFLGHKFEDGQTSGDTHLEARWRHCVLSLSLDFEPA